MKRPYLALLGIYFVNVSGLSLIELGVFMGLSGLATIFLEVPTGYFSDKVSRRWSFILGSVSVIVAALIWSFVQNQFGVYLGAFFELLGYALFSGTNQALLHDSLERLGREKDYVRIDSKSQSLSLFFNAFIITAVTATYAIDVRLPFIIGALQYAGLLVVAFMLRDIHVKHATKAAGFSLRNIRFNWLTKHSKFLAFGVVYGVFAALYTSSDKYNNLALEFYGVDPSTLGLYFAAASLVGAFLGMFVHKLKELPFKQYVSLDIFVASFSTFLFSFGSYQLAIIGFIIGMSFWRYRAIIYQQKILEKYPTRLKATLFSVLVNSEQLSRVWQSYILGVIFAGVGYMLGYTYLAAFTAVFGVVFYIFTTSLLSDTKR